jgi:hypothetical protein
VVPTLGKAHTRRHAAAVPGKGLSGYLDVAHGGDADVDRHDYQSTGNAHGRQCDPVRVCRAPATHNSAMTTAPSAAIR